MVTTQPALQKTNAKKRASRSTLMAAFIGAALAFSPTSSSADTTPNSMISAEVIPDVSAPEAGRNAGPISANVETTDEGSQIVLPDGAGVIQLPDLTSHPLAGTEIEIEIQVMDGLNQTGASRRVLVTLPSPVLVSPLGQALADIRRELALNPDTAPELAQDMLGALEEFAGELENPETAEQLQDLQERLEQTATPPSALQPSSDGQTPEEQAEELAAQEAEAEQELNDIVEEMWEAMQQLEEDSLSDAEKALNELSEQLREAIESGAPQEEIDALMQQAQEAMQELLAEQAEQAEAEDDEAAQEAFEEMQEMLEDMQEMMEEMSPDQQEMSQQMMQQMMQQMQQMQQQQRAQQSGQQQQGEQMTAEEMQQMMQQMQEQMQQMQEMQEMNEELTEIIEDQVELMNETIDQADVMNSDQTDDVIEAIWPFLERLEERSNGVKLRNDAFVNEMRIRHEQELQNLLDGLSASAQTETEQRQARELLELDQAVERASHLNSFTNRVDILISGVASQRVFMERQRDSNAGMSVGQARGNATTLERLMRGLMILEMQQRDDLAEQMANDNATPDEGINENAGGNPTTAPSTNVTPDVQPQQPTTAPRGTVRDFPPPVSPSPESSEPSQAEVPYTPPAFIPPIPELSETETELGELRAAREATEVLTERNSELRIEQQRLQNQLQNMIRQMERNGMDPGALSDAVQSMEEAERLLNRDFVGEAVQPESEALQALREGQEQLQQQMQQMMQGQGQGQPQPGSGQGGQGQGMPMPGGNVMDGDSQGLNIANPNQELGITPEDGANRTRDIRDDIRTRLGMEDISADERRYLLELLEQGIGGETPVITRPNTPAPRP